MADGSSLRHTPLHGAAQRAGNQSNVVELERQVALASRPIPQVVLAAGAERDDRRGAGNGRARGVEPLNAQRAALGAGVVCK
jgi:hypothetical protein